MSFSDPLGDMLTRIRIRAFSIELKYFEGEAVIREIKRVSKPGRRVYSSVKTLPQVRNGLGISILSTPKGVMSDAAARENNVDLPLKAIKMPKLCGALSAQWFRT